MRGVDARSHVEDLRSYDVFVDLSAARLDAGESAAHVRRLQVHCGFAQSAGRLTVAFPPKAPGQQAPGDATASWARAVVDATLRHRHLVVIVGGLLVGSEAIPPLLDALQEDPMFGTAQPRFACADDDTIWPLPSGNDNLADIRRTSRGSIRLLPGTLLTAEMLAACLVIRREVVASIEPANDYASITGALSHALCQARRRGFRNVVANRVIVASTYRVEQAYPSPPAGDAGRLLAQYPDTSLATMENEQLPQRRLEPLLSAAYPGFGEPRRLLIDCRGLATLHNGTSQCVLGMLDGFAAIDTPWRIVIQSSSAAAAFHNLEARYPGIERLDDQMSGSYAAVLLLNQPWGMHQVAELHHHAYLIMFNILDTIAWDILYAVQQRLELLWRFIGRHADVLTYISQYSRDRFRRRFPVAPTVTEDVVYLSLLSDEQTLRPFRGMPPGDHVLLFGNDYDHKGIGPTIDLLARSFPQASFVVLGGREPPAPNVRTIASGVVSQEDVHRLIATARAIVYPSFYEGFGLPVVEGLAYGCPTLVRRSLLWSEIAAQSRLGGMLIEFDDLASLVEKLSQVLDGLTPPGLPFGTALANEQTPVGWRDSAAAILKLVDARLADADARHWFERDEALRMAQQ
jgi:glycosyltransferase involved in cell wall biosynthesis